MKITLFGGAFDPPHIGHKYIADFLVKDGIANEVWFVPCFIHPFDKKMSKKQHRLAMLEFLVNKNVRITTYEVDQDEPSYSYKTLVNLKKKYPEHEFSWVIGSDNLENFHKWDLYKKMLEEFTVYVYPRKGFEMKPLYNNMIALSQCDEVDVSSTMIREKLSSNEKINELVLSEVSKYIEENNLYEI